MTPPRLQLKRRWRHLRDTELCWRDRLWPTVWISHIADDGHRTDFWPGEGLSISVTNEQLAAWREEEEASP